MDEQPTVSVVITAYNAEPFIAQTLQSVLAQTYRGFEVVVVDDGSTDGTAAVVESYGPPVRCLRQRNRGQPAARNAGIRASRGAHVAFLDADDLWHPEKLERQMRLHEEQPELAWSYTDTYYFASETGKITARAGGGRALPAGHALRPLLLDGFISAVTPVVRREVFEAVGGFNEAPEVRIGEDWEMWLRVAERYRVGVLEEPVAYVRLHDASMTHAMDFEHGLRSRLRVLRAALARHPALAAEVGARAEANVYAAMGRRALAQDARGVARRFFAEALRRAPTHAMAWRYALASLLPWPVLRLAGRLRRRLRRVPEKEKGLPERPPAAARRS